MKLSFKNIHIENFLSFGASDICLNEGGYTLVNGVNQNPDDTAKSNGSGKSTIFEAIIWCLTGETMRGSKDVTNIHGTNGALVELTFDVDEDEYKVLRTKEHSKYKNNLKLFVNSEDKSGKGIRDTEKILSEYLPDLTSELIGSVIILGQGLPQRFTNNTPSGRKEVLEKLSKSDFMLEDLKNRIADRKNTLQASLRQCEDDILQNNSKKSLLESQIKENEIKLSCMTDTKSIDENISLVESSILDNQIKYNTINDSISDFNVKYENYLKDKNAATEELSIYYGSDSKLKDSIGKINVKIQEEKSNIDNKFSSLIMSASNSITEVNSILKSKQAELLQIKNIKDICPTCGQKLNGVFKPDTNSIEKEIADLTDKLTTLKASYDSLLLDKKIEMDAANVKHENELFILKQQEDELSTKVQKQKSIISSIDTNIYSLQTDIKNYRETLNAYDSKIKGYEQRLSELKVEKETFYNKKEALKEVISSNQQVISSIDAYISSKDVEKISISKHIEVINKMNTVVTRDFRGYLLTNIIDFIDKKAKEYSMEVFETDKIDFILDGNNISITYDGKSFESLSGGEKQKCDVIIQFSIRDMLCKYLGFSSNILVLDEICDNVDSVGAEKLFNMISSKLSDVQDIFIISHHSDFQLPCDRQLTVIKDINKISRVEYAV